MTPHLAINSHYSQIMPHMSLVETLLDLQVYLWDKEPRARLLAQQQHCTFFQVVKPTLSPPPTMPEGAWYSRPHQQLIFTPFLMFASFVGVQQDLIVI